MSWNREMPELNNNAEFKEDNTHPITPKEPNDILDSGDRTEFNTGAVRDMHEGKGRCDLMPLDVLSYYYQTERDMLGSWIFSNLDDYLSSGNVDSLYEALNQFITEMGAFPNDETMFLEVAKHFEDGCKKYGENNWRKGIPIKFYIDSATRHLLKYIRGDKDERHDRAFCWNIMCAIWTHDQLPDLRIHHD